MFGHKLKTYRLSKGWTLDQLVDAISMKGGRITKAALSKFESGKLNPSIKSVTLLAETFELNPLELIAPVNYKILHLAFRKKVSLSKQEESQIVNTAELELEKYVWLNECVSPDRFPKNKIERKYLTSDYEVEDLAKQVRRDWDLGDYPIPKLSMVLEKNGFFIKPIKASEKFDGYSIILEDENKNVLTGLSLYNESHSGDRQRLSLSHELGHFLLYNDDLRMNEKLAYRFASAFLMPETEVKATIGNKRANLGMDELISYKKHFGTSIQAIIYRLKDLNIISESYATDWFKRFNLLGIKKNEPGSVEKETPKHIETLVRRAVADGFLSVEEAMKKYAVEIKDDNVKQLSRIEQFLLLPRVEQDKILEQQSKLSVEYYKEDKDLNEFREFDIDGNDN